MGRLDVCERATFPFQPRNAKVNMGSCERVERVNVVAQIGFCNATEYEQHFFHPRSFVEDAVEAFNSVWEYPNLASL